MRRSWGVFKENSKYACISMVNRMAHDLVAEIETDMPEDACLCRMCRLRMSRLQLRLDVVSMENTRTLGISSTWPLYMTVQSVKCLQ